MKIRKIKLIIMMMLLIFVFFIFPNCVDAAVTYYSDVLDDLRTDPNFNVADFEKFTLNELKDLNNDDNEENDLSIVKVIHVAESVNDELYIYTYEPTLGNFNVEITSLLIAFNYTHNGIVKDPVIKDLELVSTYSVFRKYRVLDYQISSEGYRFYNIVSLYREPNSELDNMSEPSLSEKAIEVGQQWALYSLNDDYTVEMNTFETVEIDYTISSSIRFNNGINFDSLMGVHKKGDAHFIGFTCDEYTIKKVFDADISFKTQYVSYSSTSGYTEDPASERQYRTLTQYQTAEFKGTGIGGKTFNWFRISKGDSFVEKMEEQGLEFDADAREKTKSSDYVFAYLETQRTSSDSMASYQYRTYYNVLEVSVIRLHFQDIHDNVYNLGVVSDKVNSTGVAGSNNPSILDDLDDIKELIQKVFAFIGVILLIILIFIVWTPIKTLFSMIVTFGLLIINILLFPFKLLGKIFKRR